MQDVSAVARESVIALLVRRWRDPAGWATAADIFVILIALSLPWSTTLVGIFAAASIVSMAPFLDARTFLESLKRPICSLPLALFALAVVGTLWSDAPWATRLYAIGPPAKLLMVPLLFYHFERSARGVQVFIAFLVSCTQACGRLWRPGQKLYRPEPGICPVRRGTRLSDRHSVAHRKNDGGGIAGRNRAELCR
jgi:O-antigen ligase